jgi:hypothetical protein
MVHAAVRTGGEVAFHRNLSVKHKTSEPISITRIQGSEKMKEAVGNALEEPSHGGGAQATMAAATGADDDFGGESSNE